MNYLLSVGKILVFIFAFYMIGAIGSSLVYYIINGEQWTDVGANVVGALCGGIAITAWQYKNRL